MNFNSEYDGHLYQLRKDFGSEMLIIILDESSRGNHSGNCKASLIQIKAFFFIIIKLYYNDDHCGHRYGIKYCINGVSIFVYSL